MGISTPRYTLLTCLSLIPACNYQASLLDSAGLTLISATNVAPET